MLRHGETGQQPEAADQQAGGDIACEMNAEEKTTKADEQYQAQRPVGDLEALTRAVEIACNGIGKKAVYRHRTAGVRSEERREGKGRCSRVRSRGVPDIVKTKYKTQTKRSS